MEDRTIEEVSGRDESSNTSYRVLLLPRGDDDFLSFSHRGLHIRFRYHFDNIGHSISKYQLLLAGTLAEGHRVALAWYLELAGVPSSALNATVDLIFATHGPTTSLLGVNNDVEARVEIEVYGYVPTDREDLEDDFTLHYDPNGGELDRGAVEEVSAAEFGRPRRPACRDVVEALGKVVVRAAGSNCGVCLEGFEFGYEATKMPCSHTFHGGCIVRWLEYSCFCPLCRFVLQSDG